MIGALHKYLLRISILICLSAGISIAHADEYLLGPGDVIRLSVYGQPDLTTETRISDNGLISMPLLGSVEVAGKSTAQASQLVSRLLESGNYLQNPHVNLLVTEYRSQTVAVLGQVRQPGRLVLEGKTSLTDALAMAGGIADSGSERVILIRPDDSGRQTRQQFDLRLWLDQQAAERNAVYLQSGDTLYVPVADRFYVRGEVRQPGTFILDRPVNVMQAVSLSGGFTGKADRSGIRLFRQHEDGSVQELSAGLTDPILDGDVLMVEESLF